MLRMEIFLMLNKAAHLLWQKKQWNYKLRINTSEGRGLSAWVYNFWMLGCLGVGMLIDLGLPRFKWLSWSCNKKKNVLLVLQRKTDYELHMYCTWLLPALGDCAFFPWFRCTPIRVQYLRRDYVMYIFFGVDSNAITVDDPSNECIIGDS